MNKYITRAVVILRIHIVHFKLYLEVVDFMALLWGLVSTFLNLLILDIIIKQIVGLFALLALARVPH